jgi:hypothetical protein
VYSKYFIGRNSCILARRNLATQGRIKMRIVYGGSCKAVLEWQVFGILSDVQYSTPLPLTTTDACSHPTITIAKPKFRMLACRSLGTLCRGLLDHVVKTGMRYVYLSLFCSGHINMKRYPGMSTYTNLPYTCTLLHDHNLNITVSLHPA